MWVLDTDGRVRTEKIKTGIYDTRYAEITEGDIEEGQTGDYRISAPVAAAGLIQIHVQVRATIKETACREQFYSR